MPCNKTFRPFRTGLSGFIVLILFLFFSCLPGMALAESPGSAAAFPLDVTRMNLQELMAVKITSVSKKPQAMSETAAAVFVITQEDIRRSGAASIPDALRMVPGIQVAHITANQWAISMRGFNNVYSNKLLVLMDGRSVYSPLFAGVYWDAQDTLLEDIERIEVIRGPGASVWGANAVNGIINIITKNAGDTQGGLVSAGGGTVEKGFGGVRYGARAGDTAFYRVYAKYFQRDGFVDENGNKMDDDWDAARAGFRLDWGLSGIDSLTAQGDAYTGSSWQNIFSSRGGVRALSKEEIDLSGGDFLVCWTREFSPASRTVLQAYYDNTERSENNLVQNHDIFDLDFQHYYRLTERQEIVWGLGYRMTHGLVKNSEVVSYDPGSRTDHLYSAFIQDEIELWKSGLRLTLGSKFEHNDYSQFEIQPTARLLWTPHEHHTLWTSVSRAVRSPSRTEHDLTLATPRLVITGNRNFESEELTAYEAGYRALPTDHVSLDVTAFFNKYDKLAALELGSPAGVVPMILEYRNGMEGETSGVEVFAGWNVTSRWELTAGYSYIQMNINARAPMEAVKNPAASSGFLEGNTPVNQFQFRSSLDLPFHLEFDTAVFYVDDLSSQEASDYVRVDARLGWKPMENLDAGLVFQNLAEGHHKEFNGSSGTVGTEVPRSVYGKISWRF
ncbi:MAG: TonB-dependent receptor [Nitrospinae bacterium]|nr:TonB-dependent receptor [Nitrospinota bacterium]